MNTTKKKIGLALSGGGYRAAAYHIGTLRALHRLGILNKVDVISSVSGGSITAAYYALNKDNYEDFEKGFTQSLSKGVLWLSITYLSYIHTTKPYHSTPYEHSVPSSTYLLWYMCSLSRSTWFLPTTYLLSQTLLCNNSYK